MRFLSSLNRVMTAGSSCELRPTVASDSPFCYDLSKLSTGKSPNLKQALHSGWTAPDSCEVCEFTSPTRQRGICRNVFPRWRFGLVWDSKAAVSD